MKQVDVIIPTTGRRDSIRRAIDSITIQSVDAGITLVVNGGAANPALLNSLDPGINIVYVERASVSNARYVGRKEHVTAPFFAFLDDDDELLPGALETRLAAITDADVVATNGCRHRVGGDDLAYRSITSEPDAALAAVLTPWLASCGGLFRTSAIGAETFHGLPDFLELTYLALRLALRHKVVRIDTPTFVLHEDTEDRASDSAQFLEAVPNVLSSMAEITDRADILSVIRRRRAASLHACAEFAAHTGQRTKAWRFHTASLLSGGWRYLSYSRHLLVP